MTRSLSLLALLLAACTGGPIDTYGTPHDTSADTGASDTGSDTGTTDTALGPDQTASEGIFRDCAEAEASSANLAPGTYTGTTDDWTTSMDGSCVAGGGAGPDKMFRIDVPNDETLSVDFGVTGNDARIYLVEDCHSANTCLASVNEHGENATEHLDWGNSTGSTVTVYGVLDTHDAASPGDTWTLTVALSAYTPPFVLPDTCNDVGNVDPITASGTYNIVTTGDTGNYDGYAAGCGYADGYGIDGVVPVVVPDGATVHASWWQPGCDASAYIETTCGDTGSCLGGGNAPDTGSPAVVTAQNTTGAQQTWSLVLDNADYACTSTTDSPGSLDVTIDPYTPLALDTCTEAQAADPVAPGNVYVQFAGTSNDIDLADATTSCTGHPTPGDDVFLPVTVPSGKQLYATFVPQAGNAALYVLTACDDPNSCIAGSDSGDPEDVAWTNTTDQDATVYVVVDSGYPEGDPSAPTVGVLQLAVLDPIVPTADTCDGIDSVPFIGDGTYTVALDGYTASFDPYGNRCGSVYAAGPEGFARVAVPSRGKVDLDYTAGSCDAVLYASKVCGDTSTCVGGSDANGSGQSEHLAWTNRGTATVDLVVGLDTYGTSCWPTFADPGSLTVQITPPPSPAADTCDGAKANIPAGSGIYPLDLSSATATLDPADNSGCGDVTSAHGADTFVPFAVGAGQQIDLTLDVDQGLPDLYLLGDCADLTTCDGGTSTGTPEQLSWFNDGPATTVYAVVDTNAADGSPDEPQYAFLEADIYAPVVATTAGDDCASATALGPLSNGTYSIDLSGFTNTLDLADGSGTPCTNGLATPGNDGIFEVDVPAGATLDATWDPSTSTSGSRNGLVYLLSDCGNADACVTGSSSGDPESITWTNNTANDATMWLVVDSWNSSGGPNAGILTLSVAP